MSFSQENSASMKGSSEDINISNQEMQSISEAMKKPEFVEMLGEYMNEISDPANREEYDQYLRQLEKEDDLPEGMQLLEPQQAFCLKTHTYETKNKEKTQKLFINVCQSDKVQKGEQKEKTAKGASWRLPFILGKVRLDQDKHKAICQTVEICFNPNVLALSKKNPAYLDLVCQTALEQVSKGAFQDKDSKVSKDYKVLKKTQCKGGKPATLTVRTQYLTDLQQSISDNKKRNEMLERQGGLSDKAPKLFQEFQKQQKEHKKTKKEEDKKQVEEEDIQEEEQIKNKKEEEKKKQDQEELDTRSVMKPKFSIMYQYETDYGDFVEQREQEKKQVKRLVLKVQLLKVKKVSEIKLDVNDTSCILDVKAKYYLDIVLPLPVKEEGQGAKWDAKTKSLTVTLECHKQVNAPAPSSLIQEVSNDSQQEKQEQQQQQQQDQDQEQKQEIKKDQEQEQEQEIEQEQEQKQEIRQEKEQQKSQEEEQKQQLEKDLQDYQQFYENDQKVIEIAKDQEKQLVQEIKEEKKEEVFEELSCVLQETEGVQFVVIKIIDYKEENIEKVIWENEVMVQHRIEGKVQWAHVHIDSPIDNSLSHFSMVKDYVVANLPKETKAFWNNKGVTQINSDYDSFSQKFSYLKQQNNQFNQKIKEDQMKESEDNQNQNEEQENNEDQQDQLEVQKANNVQFRKEKKNIQFINFKAHNHFYELD